MKITRWIGLAVIGFSFQSIFIKPAEATPDVLSKFLSFCVDTSGTTRDRVKNMGACRDGTGADLRIPYLDDGKAFVSSHPKVTKGILVIHGAGGRPSSVFDPVIGNIRGMGQDENVWLVAPQFLEINMLSGLSGDILQWSDVDGKGYAFGDTSLRPNSAQVSSFELADLIVRKMVELAPNITEFVVIGFSGGARFVNRYSMGTLVDDGKTIPSVKFRYLIVSPGSYTFLNGKRYESNEKQIIPPEIKSPSSGCPGYNDYPYGLSLIPAQHYLNDAPKTPSMQERVARKQRLFLVGSQDTQSVSTPKEPEYCAEHAQGANRRNSAFNYMHHLRTEGAAKNASFCVVEGAAHDPVLMLGSAVSMFFWKDDFVDCSLSD